MNLIVETDLGHDPDDFFALCYLSSVPGVNIRAITLVPGDLDQLAIARFFAEETGQDIKIGASNPTPKRSSGGVHHDMLKKYGRCFEGTPDGDGPAVVAAAIHQYPDAELFVIGPVTSIGKVCQRQVVYGFGERPELVRRATMQGGFLSYFQYQPKRRLEKFEGRVWVPTFNLNGDRKGANGFITGNIPERRFVGKNVCHNVLYNRRVLARTQKPACRAAELFVEAMGIYLARHPEKKFHDPTAAVCHLHPEVGTWVRGNPTRIEEGWGTDLSGRDHILADIDYDQLWEHITNWK